MNEQLVEEVSSLPVFDGFIIRYERISNSDGSCLHINRRDYEARITLYPIDMPLDIKHKRLYIYDLLLHYVRHYNDIVEERSKKLIREF